MVSLDLYSFLYRINMTYWVEAWILSRHLLQQIIRVLLSLKLKVYFFTIFVNIFFPSRQHANLIFLVNVRAPMKKKHVGLLQQSAEYFEKKYSVHQ